MRAPRAPPPRWFRARFEDILGAYPPAARLANDPVLYPRQRLVAGAARADIESVALLAAMLSYGRVTLFMPVIQRILDGCPPPYPAGFLSPSPGFTWPGYRFSTGADLRLLAAAAIRVGSLHGGLWEAFSDGWRADRDTWAGLAALRGALLAAALAHRDPPSRGLLYLLPDPGSGGCAKRWMMFLRWMARPDDGVDLGLWPGLPPSALRVPLDRHVGRFARRFGWTRRAADDRRAVEEITAALRRLSPEDPLRYDFAISHMGIDGMCTHGRDPAACAACAFGPACRPALRLKTGL